MGKLTGLGKADRRAAGGGVRGGRGHVFLCWGRDRGVAVRFNAGGRVRRGSAPGNDRRCFLSAFFQPGNAAVPHESGKEIVFRIAIGRGAKFAGALYFNWRGAALVTGIAVLGFIQVFKGVVQTLFLLFAHIFNDALWGLRLFNQGPGDYPLAGEVLAGAGSPLQSP